MKSRLLEFRVFLASFVSLVLFGIVLLNFQEIVAAQFPIHDDVKHNTPASPSSAGQSLHIDVELALVNVTVTDPHDRPVTGQALSSITFASSRTTSSKKSSISLPRTCPFRLASLSNTEPHSGSQMARPIQCEWHLFAAVWQDPQQPIADVGCRPRV